MSNSRQKLKTSSFAEDISGKMFGRLRAIRCLGFVSNGDALWFCECSCGNNKEVRTRCLNSGKTVSCGCQQLESVTKHGMSKTSEASIWRNMKYRCNNPNASNYANYGGRGIKVCDRWLESFENFFEDMGERPSKEHSLDRIDNTKGYSPDNCRWATSKEQARNRRDCRLITFRGVTKSVIEFCEEYKLQHRQLLSRLESGWDIEKALTSPIRARRV